MINCSRLFSRPALLHAAVLVCATSLFVSADDNIPRAAWRIPIGQPPANPGGRKPELAPDSNIDDGYWQGAPVGGFGAGTFSRSYRGHYERWHIKAGVHKYQDVPANQFAVFVQPQGGQPVAEVLATGKPQDGALSAWNWNYPGGGGEYAALYPKSWFAYGSSELPVKLTVEQFSPVLPNNYRETSYPVAIYNWFAENPRDTTVTVSILFSWTNMVGWFRDQMPNLYGALNNQNKNFYRSEQIRGGTMQGVVFDRLRSGPVQEEWDGQFAIAALAGAGVEVTYSTNWSPYASGTEIWKPFATDGRLPNWAPNLASAGEPIAAAIAVRFTLAPHQKSLIPMALSWDLPIVEFGGGRKWLRRYTKFFDASGSNAWKIARTALEDDQSWSDQIDAWQQPFIDDESKPLWYRGELFNELYDLADGGTMWAHELNGFGNPKHPSAKMADSFSYLECFDYKYYGTSDVRFYGSFPLVKFWPDIEKQEMREYTDTIPESNPQEYVWAWKQQHNTPALMQRKTAGSAPHDLGSPTEDPFVNANQYNYQDVSNWRDLNSKYVLMVWRDYVFSGSSDTDFLRYTWKAVKMAMEHLRQYDKDGDGLIENGGFPDQTYDNWVARGESSYSGSLYLAALRATAEIARKLGDNSSAKNYDDLFKRAQAAFIKKLWNGQYFNYDVGSDYKTDIMAEQLAGQWYADLTGLGDLVPEEMRRSALKHVFDYNVMKFQNGTMGAVNGIAANGDLLHENEQVEEVWTGTTFSVASHMLAEGMRDEGFKTAEGVYNVVWKDRGYFFRTPEAYDSRGLYRASMYMRPGAIWSMEMVKAPSTEHAQRAAK
ncbi:MAG TPA: non-lysosomal glucosylceramidase [Terriglobales bacterium]|nr:non-lysosomal glucosylceramidase [Terriglobales bacterium]